MKVNNKRNTIEMKRIKRQQQRKKKKGKKNNYIRKYSISIETKGCKMKTFSYGGCKYF